MVLPQWADRDWSLAARGASYDGASGFMMGKRCAIKLFGRLELEGCDWLGFWEGERR